MYEGVEPSSGMYEGVEPPICMKGWSTPGLGLGLASTQKPCRNKTNQTTNSRV